MIQKDSISDFIHKSRLVHGDKYDYSKSKYTTNHNKVVIICPLHGEFNQRASNHKSGRGCDYCGGTKSFNKGKFIDNKDGSYLIPITKGEFAVIDKEDFILVSKHSWQLKKDGGNKYAKTTINIKGEKANLKMHRVILGITDPSILIDHINHNGLDNRKVNLRESSHLTNSHNTIARKGTSRFKGVCKPKGSDKWISYITINKKRKHLGSFSSEEKAAMAYDVMAKKHFGEYSNLNFK